MATYRGRWRLRAVPRPWFDVLALAVVDEVEQRVVAGTVPGVELVSGRGAQPGSRYRLVDEGGNSRGEIEIERWDRAGSLRVRTTSEGTTTITELRSPRHPRQATCEVRFPDGRASGELDLDRWFAADGHRVLTGRVRRRLVLVDVGASVRSDGPGWIVDVRLRARGRRWWRPVLWPAFLLAGGRARSHVRTAIDGRVASWNEWAGAAVDRPPSKLAVELVDAAVAASSSAASGPTGEGVPSAPGAKRRRWVWRSSSSSAR